MSGSLKRLPFDVVSKSRAAPPAEPEVDRWPMACTVLLVLSASGILWLLIIQGALWLIH